MVNYVKLMSNRAFEVKEPFKDNVADYVDSYSGPFPTFVQRRFSFTKEQVHDLDQAFKQLQPPSRNKFLPSEEKSTAEIKLSFALVKVFWEYQVSVLNWDPKPIQGMKKEASKDLDQWEKDMRKDKTGCNFNGKPLPANRPRYASD